MTIPADTKDWTVVLREGCSQCGFEPGYPYEENKQRIFTLIEPALAAFEREDLTQRPNEITWAPLEYLAHVAEVATVMEGRLHLMLNQDAPTFPNWDQDAAATENDYLHQSPDQVAQELRTNFEQAAEAFDAVRPEDLDRKGLRGNGAAFTVRTLAEYFVHDLEHHVNKDLA